MRKRAEIPQGSRDGSEEEGQMADRNAEDLQEAQSRSHRRSVSAVKNFDAAKREQVKFPTNGP